MSLGSGRVRIGQGHERIYVDQQKRHTSAATGFFVNSVCRHATGKKMIRTFFAVVSMIMKQQLENSHYVCQLRRRREESRRKEEEDKPNRRLLYLSPHPARKSKEQWMKVRSQDWWSWIVRVASEGRPNEHALNDRNYF
ncbi:hypothetical protein NL108_013301 [Boleophthalmus pectinirostris]|nr:hypothetical protein NL108_013301 [Boleophthalmus pectinirostris]